MAKLKRLYDQIDDEFEPQVIIIILFCTQFEKGLKMSSSNFETDWNQIRARRSQEVKGFL